MDACAGSGQNRVALVAGLELVMGTCHDAAVTTVELKQLLLTTAAAVFTGLVSNESSRLTQTHRLIHQLVNK